MTEQAPWAPQPPQQPQPQQPPQPPPVGKGTYYAIIGVLVALLAGCCYGGVKIFGGDDDEKDKAAPAVGVRTPGQPAQSSAAPLSDEDFKGALSATDQALKQQISALSAKDRGPLATALRAEADKLEQMNLPPNARAAARQASGALDALAIAVQSPPRSDCKAGSQASKLLTSDAADQVRYASKILRTIDPTWVFGTFLPAAPKEQNRRLPNGTIITKRAGGPGVLEVKNSSGDKAISLVPVKSKKATLTFYLQSGKTKRINSIKSGTYKMYVASGEDWDSKAKGFTRDCDFTEFDDTYKFAAGYIWTIQLTKQIGGNASTSDADPDQFEN